MVIILLEPFQNMFRKQICFSQTIQEHSIIRTGERSVHYHAYRLSCWCCFRGQCSVSIM